MSSKVRYFIDTEFIESGPDHPIYPLSVGIVCEDGREFYEFFHRTPEELALANEFVQEHVLPKIGYEYLDGGWVYGTQMGYLCSRMRLRLSPGEMRDGILKFVGDSTPEFWGYFADYDWVVFCQIFGIMVDLPEGWPRYCMDLKQLSVEWGLPRFPKPLEEKEHHALNDARWNRDSYNWAIDCILGKAVSVMEERGK